MFAQQAHESCKLLISSHCSTRVERESSQTVRGVSYFLLVNSCSCDLTLQVCRKVQCIVLFSLSLQDPPPPHTHTHTHIHTHYTPPSPPPPPPPTHTHTHTPTPPALVTVQQPDWVHKALNIHAFLYKQENHPTRKILPDSACIDDCLSFSGGMTDSSHPPLFIQSSSVRQNSNYPSGKTKTGIKGIRVRTGTVLDGYRLPLRKARGTRASFESE